MVFSLADADQNHTPQHFVISNPAFEPVGLAQIWLVFDQTDADVVPLDGILSSGMSMGVAV